MGQPAGKLPVAEGLGVRIDRQGGDRIFIRKIMQIHITELKGVYVKDVRFCLLFVVVAAIMAIVACREQIVEDPPLLLEDAKAGPVADNSRCHVCHINYEEEELAVVHARANISCEQCHGSSDAHCGDEDNITPPDVMYPQEKINGFCKDCHPDSKLSGDKKYCTDCHGEHRLGYRTRRWDKTTGKLIADDKVRMLTDEVPE